MTAPAPRLEQAHARPPDPASAASGRRLVALDGLRGVAAVVVLLHHTLEVAAPHLKGRDGAAGMLWWALTETPLKVLTAGGEAVVLFFVLSGLVVALPVLHGRRFSWSGFMVSRVVRIMLPVWGSLLFAAALLVLIPRDPARVPEGSWLSDNNATTLSFGMLMDEAMLARYSYDVNNVLWSLRWELLFALLLPLFVLAARSGARAWITTGVVTFALSVAGFAMRDGTLSYLPAFFLGTLLAVRLGDFRAWAEESSARRWFTPAWSVLLAAALLAFVASWLARPWIPSGEPAGQALRSLSVLGSIVVIGLALVAAPVARVLSSRVCGWLGRISFSLYLVHVPLLVTLAYLLGDEDWKLVVLVAPILSVVVAHGFWRVVEKPSHALARSLGRRFARPVAEDRSAQVA